MKTIFLTLILLAGVLATASHHGDAHAADLSQDSAHAHHAHHEHESMEGHHDMDAHHDINAHHDMGTHHAAPDDGMADSEVLEIDPERLENFVADLSSEQVAVVSVNGLVCDFCARGIEKTFHREESVRKVDVDLRQGKVLIAYAPDHQIDYEDIEEKILSNGQNAVGMHILNLSDVR